MSPTPRRRAADFIAAHLWDLRSDAEAQLRWLTTVQRMVDSYGRPSDAVLPPSRTALIEALTTLQVSIARLQRTSSDALQAASELP